MIDFTQVEKESPLLDEKMKEELRSVFAKLEAEIVLRAVLDLADEKGVELASFLRALSGLSDKIGLELYDSTEPLEELNTAYLPVTGLYKNGKYSGAAFHGVPGGKEINSFVLAIYNLAGPGQDISRGLVRKIQKLDKKTNIKVCVSLACHHCPKVVVACQRLAVLNDNIETEMIDANLYKDLIEQYKIERVPVIIVNDREVFIGPKTIEEMIDIVKKVTKRAK